MLDLVSPRLTRRTQTTLRFALICMSFLVGGLRAGSYRGVKSDSPVIIQFPLNGTDSVIPMRYTSDALAFTIRRPTGSDITANQADNSVSFAIDGCEMTAGWSIRGLNFQDGTIFDAPADVKITLGANSGANFNGKFEQFEKKPCLPANKLFNFTMKAAKTKLKTKEIIFRFDDDVEVFLPPPPAESIFTWHVNAGIIILSIIFLSILFFNVFRHFRQEASARARDQAMRDMYAKHRKLAEQANDAEMRAKVKRKKATPPPPQPPPSSSGKQQKSRVASAWSIITGVKEDKLKKARKTKTKKTKESDRDKKKEDSPTISSTQHDDVAPTDAVKN